MNKVRLELQRQKELVGQLSSLVAKSPGKVDQAELLSLRTFKDFVQGHIKSQRRSLEELNKAVPQSSTIIEGLAEKPKAAIQGKSKNE